MATKRNGKGAGKGGDRRADKPPATRAGEGAEELLTMQQAIELLKTTRATFYRWLRSGRIQGMKVGRQWRFERGEIRRFLRGEDRQVEQSIAAADRELGKVYDSYDIPDPPRFAIEDRSGAGDTNPLTGF